MEPQKPGHPGHHSFATVNELKAPLAFIFPDRLRDKVKITYEAPPPAYYHIPAAEKLLKRWDGGFMSEQSIVGKNFGLSLLTFSIEKRIAFTVEAAQNFNTIQHTLKGETICFLRGYGFMPLVEMTYTSMYIPAGRHIVWFEPGVYIYLYTILTEDHLTELAADHPNLSTLIAKLKTASSEGTMLDRMNVDTSVLDIINRLENLTRQGTDLYLDLQQIIIDMLRAYSRHIHLKERKDRHITPGEYADMVKLYVIDNIADPVKMRMESLEKEFHVSERTLERYFLKKFGQPLRAYMKSKRLERSLYMLLAETGSVTEVAEKLGYYDVATFSRQFSKQYGFSPKQVKERYFK